MPRGSSNLRDTVAIHPLLILVIILAAAEFGLMQITPTGTPPTSLLAQAVSPEDTTALDQQCPDGPKYDYTCPDGEQSQTPGKYCVKDLVVSNDTVEGVCVSPGKAEAVAYKNSSGGWSALPDGGAASEPSSDNPAVQTGEAQPGVVYNGGFYPLQTTGLTNLPSAEDETGGSAFDAPSSGQLGDSTSGLSPGTDYPQTFNNSVPAIQDSNSVRTVDMTAAYPSGAQFMPSETDPLVSTFGAAPSGQLDVPAPASSLSSNEEYAGTFDPYSSYDISNQVGVCNGCFSNGQISGDPLSYFLPTSSAAPSQTSVIDSNSTGAINDFLQNSEPTPGITDVSNPITDTPSVSNIDGPNVNSAPNSYQVASTLGPTAAQAISDRWPSFGDNLEMSGVTPSTNIEDDRLPTVELTPVQSLMSSASNFMSETWTSFTNLLK